MKNWIVNNWKLKLLSVGIALVIWVVVVNYDNPYVTRTISNIPIELVNEETLTSHDMVYTVDGTQTATIRVRCPRKVSQKLKASDFKAEADFNNMYTLTNQVPVTITCTNSSVTSDEITQLTQSIQIELEDVLTKKMDVVVNVTGEPDSGYQVGEVTSSPSSVTVRAPQSFLDQISYVGVEVNVDGITQTMSKTLPLQFYNAGGNVMTFDTVQELSVSATDIDVEVEILNVKTVSLDYTVTGQEDVAEGYLYSGIEIDPASVEISGRKSTLADISVLRIPEGELDVSGASQNIVKTFDARELLPDGVSLVDSENYTITVTLKIEKLTTREFSLDTTLIQVENLDEDYDLEFLSDSIEVSIQGLDSDLSALSESELTASIDLEGFFPGTHYANVSLEVPYGFNVIGTPRVRLTITEHAEDQETSSVSDSEGTEESGTVALPSEDESDQ